MNHFIIFSFILAFAVTASISLEFKDDEQEYNPDAESEGFKEFYDEYDEEHKKPMVYDLNKAEELFEKFAKDYNKKYNNRDDYKNHYKNFVENLKYINEVNSAGRSYSTGINLFSDLSDAEIANMHN